MYWHSYMGLGEYLQWHHYGWGKYMYWHSYMGDVSVVCLQIGTCCPWVSTRFAHLWICCVITYIGIARGRTNMYLHSSFLPATLCVEPRQFWYLSKTNMEVLGSTVMGISLINALFSIQLSTSAFLLDTYATYTLFWWILNKQYNILELSFIAVGYPLGGVMYQFVGKMQPFLVIAALVVAEGGM